jgi:Uma2 family endonuclease
MATAAQITTAEQLLQASGLGPCELVRGELTMVSPPGFRHGRVETRITHALNSFVESRGLGVVVSGESGFHIARDPDTVRAPDVAFIRAERLTDGVPVGFFQGAPDLAVEIVSPGDRASELTAKVQDWLGAGSCVVWVVDPETRTVSVCRSRTDIVVLTSSDTLPGGDLLPGFSMPVNVIFAP